MKKRININGKIYEQVSMNESLFKKEIDKDNDPLPNGPAYHIDFKGGVHDETGKRDETGAASIWLWKERANNYTVGFEPYEDIIEVAVAYHPFLDDGSKDDWIEFGYDYFSYDEKGMREADKLVKKMMRDLKNGVDPAEFPRKYKLGIQSL